MSKSHQSADVKSWFEAHAEIETVIAAIFDINGVFRGKRLPIANAGKAIEGEMKLPFSALFFDIWGRDIEGSSLVFDTGDGDGVLTPTSRLPFTDLWGDGKTAYLPMCMTEADGGAYGADPRQILKGVVSQYREVGLNPVCAMELEFYLLPSQVDHANFLRSEKNETYSADLLDLNKPFLDDLYAACDAASIPVDTATSESGRGQYEVNFVHREDAVAAADDAALFKLIARLVARKHELSASFMAKPFGKDSGNGLHVHFSLLDQVDGKNIFSDGTENGSDRLRFAVGGLIDTTDENFLVFAPHANSYRRLREGTHAPINNAWGYDNRTAAIRIPSGPDSSRRIEHRIAGADANPYLSLAAILGGALKGLKNSTIPPAPLSGNAYTSDAPRIAATWNQAIADFKPKPGEQSVFTDFFRQIYTDCKLQELQTFAERVSDFEFNTYFGTV